MKRTTPLAVLPLLFSVVLTQAFALSPGEPAPDFSVKDSQGRAVSLVDLKGKIVVLEWFNPGCPFVKKHYKSTNMQSLQERYTREGVIWITVNSTNTDHDDYIPLTKVPDAIAENHIHSTHYVVDDSGSLGKRYGAKSTPHMFVIDPTGTLVYQGAIDDDPSVSGDPFKAKNFVSAALGSLADKQAIETAETKPYGCSVKYAS